MPVSEAQKRAIQKYQAKHKDKLREYSKEYYKRKKEHNDDIMMKCKCLEDRIAEIETITTQEKKKLRYEKSRLEEICRLNGIDFNTHPKDYVDEVGSHRYIPYINAFIVKEIIN